MEGTRGVKVDTVEIGPIVPMDRQDQIVEKIPNVQVIAVTQEQEPVINILAKK